MGLTGERVSSLAKFKPKCCNNSKSQFPQRVNNNSTPFGWECSCKLCNLHKNTSFCKFHLCLFLVPALLLQLSAKCKTWMRYICFYLSFWKLAYKVCKFSDSGDQVHSKKGDGVTCMGPLVMEGSLLDIESSCILHRLGPIFKPFMSLPEALDGPAVNKIMKKRLLLKQDASVVSVCFLQKVMSSSCWLQRDKQLSVV